MGTASSKEDYAERASSLEAVGVGSAQLLRLLDSIRRCGQCDSLEESVDLIVQETCSTLGCDRATVFLVDNIREQLVITKSVGSESPDIRIPCLSKFFNYNLLYISRSLFNRFSLAT